MQWHIQSVINANHPDARLKEILRIILAERGIENQEDFVKFLQPDSPTTWQVEDLSIDVAALETLKALVYQVKEKEQLVLIYGDYDADGVTATAILQSTLQHMGVKALGYVPDRRTEGYGMKVASLQSLIDEHPDLGLVVTVDQGIVAFEASAFLKQAGIPLVITDHHQQDKKLPQANAIVHTTKTSGSGIAWLVSHYLLQSHEAKEKLAAQFMELATLGTVADLLPLQGFNRSLVAHGIQQLRKTEHLGMQALFRQAKVPIESLDTYHISYVIAPRINAMGRIAHALEALQLLTESADSGLMSEWAEKLELTNKERQDLTEELVKLAFSKITKVENILVVDDEMFDEGVVGLIAGKLVEKYHRPAVVISMQNGLAKASARSIKNIDIVKLLREAEDLMEGVGGHAMAAGFSFKSEKLPLLKERLESLAARSMEGMDLEPVLDIQCELQVGDISWQLWKYLEHLAPYGMGNQRPMFVSMDLQVKDVRTFGQDDKHIRLWLEDERGKRIGGVGFNLGSVAQDIIPGKSRVNIAYTISENTWNNKRNLELHLKDIQVIS